eukprot:6170788-Prymnesium_polylepis.1
MRCVRKSRVAAASLAEATVCRRRCAVWPLWTVAGLLCEAVGDAAQGNIVSYAGLVRMVKSYDYTTFYELSRGDAGEQCVSTFDLRGQLWLRNATS